MAKLNARTVALLSLFCLGLAIFAGQPVAAKRPHGGKNGGQNQEEDVRDTVKRVVEEAIHVNPGVGAALLRLVFHDCWVNGCDGSVLLDGEQSERQAKNNIGLAGFNVIDDIKRQLAYPDTVSCADILVLAAREATFNISRGKINYNVTTGRLDGVVSSASVADAVLPHSTFNVTELKKNFADHNFSPRELATLTGAHAVGVAHFTSFQDRLDNETATPIDDDYLRELRKDVDAKKTEVPNPIEPNNIRDMNPTFRNNAKYDPTGVDTSATGVLDNSFYHANVQNRVLFRSDWELVTDTVTRSAVRTFKADAQTWFNEFGSAMAKLSDLKGKGSQIRKKCNAINPPNY